MLLKQLFYKNRKIIFSISWWHDSSMLHSERLLCGDCCSTKPPMSSMRWSKVVKSCYQNNYFAKIEKQFVWYHDGINAACCILKGCCEPAAAQNHQKSSVRWFKVVKSCYENNYFTKMEKLFFRYHVDIFYPKRNFIWLNSLYSLMYRNTYHVTFLILPSTFQFCFLCEIRKINIMSLVDPALELFGK